MLAVAHTLQTGNNSVNAATRVSHSLTFDDNGKWKMYVSSVEMSRHQLAMAGPPDVITQLDGQCITDERTTSVSCCK